MLLIYYHSVLTGQNIQGQNIPGQNIPDKIYPDNTYQTKYIGQRVPGQTYIVPGIVFPGIFCQGIFCPGLFCPGILCLSTNLVTTNTLDRRCWCSNYQQISVYNYIPSWMTFLWHAVCVVIHTLWKSAMEKYMREGATSSDSRSLFFWLPDSTDN